MMINRETGREFLTHQEAAALAREEYPDFNHTEQKRIGALLQRATYLESCDGLTRGYKQELIALRWVLSEINDFVKED
jgi:hypothetical protein